MNLLRKLRLFPLLVFVFSIVFSASVISCGQKTAADEQDTEHPADEEKAAEHPEDQEHPADTTATETQEQ